MEYKTGLTIWRETNSNDQGPSKGAKMEKLGTFLYQKLSVIVKHPVLNVFVGVGLLIIGIDEFLKDVLPEYDGFFELHHAVMLIGLVMCLDGLIGFFERMETLTEKKEE